MKQYLLVSLLFFAIFYSNAQTTILEEKIKQLSPNTPWQLKKSVPLQFPTFHPQGMVKIGDFFYMSSVEVLKAPKNGDTGEGIGRLFKFDSTGTLLQQLTLGEGSIYHPGGIDFDGKYIWIPVAEYRPNSKSIIYKFDPKTFTAAEIMRFDEHIGAIVHNTDSNKLLGASWGSRNFYEWELNAKGKITNDADSPSKLRFKNPSFYVDYQDCHYVGNNKMLCSGLQKYTAPNGTVFRLGGFELINTLDKRPEYQVPIKLWSPSGLTMTQNPFWVESSTQGLRAYFVPDDDKASTLFIYEADLR
jgi:Family of unknown function (DUF6454)